MSIHEGPTETVDALPDASGTGRDGVGPSGAHEGDESPSAGASAADSDVTAGPNRRPGGPPPGAPGNGGARPLPGTREVTRGARPPGVPALADADAGAQGGGWRLSRLARLGGNRATVNHLLDPLVSAMRANDPRVDTSLVERAFSAADKAHAGQKRKSGQPYITHPVAVAIVRGEDDDSRLAAVADRSRRGLGASQVPFDRLALGSAPGPQVPPRELVADAVRLRHGDGAVGRRDADGERQRGVSHRDTKGR